MALTEAMTIFTALLCSAVLLADPGAGPGKASITWRDLPPLPQALGGQFVGVIGRRLVVAGGSYFNTPPWDGGKKTWVDTIYSLGPGETEWRSSGRLPTPLGYGVAISSGDALLCIGGQTPGANSKAVYRIRLHGGDASIDRLPDLPGAASMTAGALIGGTVYVAGGQDSPQSTAARHSFLALSIGKDREWRQLEAWPGPGLILPAAAEAGGALYVVSGAELTGTPGPPVGRRFVRGAYAWKPGAGWRNLALLPQPVQAGLAIGWNGKLLVFGGNDGSLADREYEVRDSHPGFSRAVLEYDPKTGRWRKIGGMPVSLVTTGIVRWGDEWVIAGGEARPAHRSARVIAGKLAPGK